MGKWILFASHEQVDCLWRSIALATTSGERGVAAQSSSVKSHKTNYAHEYVLHVETGKYQERGPF